MAIFRLEFFLNLQIPLKFMVQFKLWPPQPLSSVNQTKKETLSIHQYALLLICKSTCSTAALLLLLLYSLVRCSSRSLLDFANCMSVLVYRGWVLVEINFSYGIWNCLWMATKSRFPAWPNRPSFPSISPWLDFNLASAVAAAAASCTHNGDVTLINHRHEDWEQQ